MRIIYRSCGISLQELSAAHQSVMKALVSLKQRIPDQFESLLTSDQSIISTSICSICHQKCLFNKRKLKSKVKNTIFTYNDAITTCRKLFVLPSPSQEIGNHTLCSQCGTMLEEIQKTRVKYLTCLEKIHGAETEVRSTNCTPTTPPSCGSVRKAIAATGVTPDAKKTKVMPSPDRSHKNLWSVEELSSGMPKKSGIIKSLAIPKTGAQYWRTMINLEFEILFNNSGWKTDGDVYIENYENLNLRPMSDFIRTNCPTLCQIFPINGDGEIQIGSKEVVGLAILGFSRNRKFNLLQKSIGLDLFRNCTKKVFAKSCKNLSFR